MEYKIPYLYLLKLARDGILWTGGFYLSVKEAKVSDWMHNTREKTNVRRKGKKRSDPVIYNRAANVCPFCYANSSHTHSYPEDNLQ